MGAVEVWQQGGQEVLGVRGSKKGIGFLGV